MDNKQSLIITDIKIKRIIVQISGENTNPELKIEKFLIRDYITNDRLEIAHIEWNKNQFVISFNLMSLDHQYPIHSGDWYLVGVDSLQNNHEVHPTQELIQRIQENTYHMTNQYHAYFDREPQHYYHVESQIDQDNLSYYLKIVYKKPPEPLTLRKKIKKIMSWR